MVTQPVPCCCSPWRPALLFNSSLTAVTTIERSRPSGCDGYLYNYMFRSAYLLRRPNVSPASTQTKMRCPLFLHSHSSAGRSRSIVASSRCCRRRIFPPSRRQPAYQTRLRHKSGFSDPSMFHGAVSLGAPSRRPISHELLAFR